MNAVGGGMLRKLAEVGVPSRVHRPVGFEVPADPFDQFWAAVVFGNFNGVVNAPQPHALVHENRQLLEMIALQRDVPAASIAENDDGGGVIKRMLIGGPLIL